VLLDGDETRLALGDDAASAVVVNAGGVGFYRVAYDDTLRMRLTGDALSGLDTLERYHLVDDAWSAVVAQRLEPGGFLELVMGFAGERDLAVWQAIAAGLAGCGRLVEGTASEALAARIRTLTGPALAALGWEPAHDEDELTSKLRGLVVSLTAVLGKDDTVRHRAHELCHQARRELGSVHPELVAACTTVVAATGGIEVYDMLLTGFRTATTPQEQLRYLYALAEPHDAELVRRTCELAFSGEVKTQNAPFLLNRCIANRHHGRQAWEFVRDRWHDANEAFPVNTIVRMIDPVKLLTDDLSAVDVPEFFAEHTIPQAVATLAQVLERQQVNTSLRRRVSHTFANGLLA